ncbi:MAG TPA: hypothetical protein PKL65_00305 [Bacteroidales bacterium]|nr:hypothetical protein [Bacteroidales bacterium]
MNYIPAATADRVCSRKRMLNTALPTRDIAIPCYGLASETLTLHD